MRVHFISIGGAVMHNMALALHELGNTVTGSDDEIFEPAYSRLKARGLLPEQSGWDENKITEELDFIILGMHAKADNPELIRAKELNLKIYSFPEYIYEHSRDKTRIVIGGSHGKTSTTAMIMHVFREAGLDFDYLLGSQLEGFDTMVRLSKAPFIIIEGDEYLTSALDPVPKFLWYRPHIAILTGIAWDHINVFPTFEIYLQQFIEFIQTIESSGKLIYCEEDPELNKLAVNASCTKIPYRVPDHKIEQGVTSVISHGKAYPLQVFGKHNLQNLEAARHVCELCGINEVKFWEAVSNFKGAAKRLEKIYDSGPLKIYRDFAHSPSKLEATVKAVLEQFSGFRLIGVFELHTFSSLNREFLKEYKGSMNGLDVAIVYYNQHVFELKRMEMLKPEEVATQFGSVQVIREKNDLIREIRKNTREKTVVLLMSSGNFDGLIIQDLIPDT